MREYCRGSTTSTYKRARHQAMQPSQILQIANHPASEYVLNGFRLLLVQKLRTRCRYLSRRWPVLRMSLGLLGGRGHFINMDFRKQENYGD